MTCPHCNAQLSDGAAFCSACGAPSQPETKKKTSWNVTPAQFLLIVILYLIGFCGIRSSLSSDSNKGSMNLTSSTASASEPKEAQLVLDIPRLANQPPSAFESLLGKPTEITKITGRREHAPGEFRDYKIPGVASNRSTRDGLMVRFYKGKAVMFMLDLPRTVTTAKEAFAMAGINIGNRRPDVTALAAEVWNNVIINGKTYKNVKAVSVKAIQRGSYDLVQVEIE
jgi:hypothetical protein